MQKTQNDIVQNTEENMRSLVAKEESCFYMWSSLDLQDKSSIVKKQDKLKPLLNLFCNEKIHQVLKLTEHVEKNHDPDIWQGYYIYLRHSKNLLGSVEEVELEFEQTCPVLSWSLLTHVTRVKSQKKKPNQLEILADFGLKSSSEFPNICLLIVIMISTPSNSSPIERAYSVLEIICAKQRNCLTASHAEMLFLLSVLKLDVLKIIWNVFNT